MLILREVLFVLLALLPVWAAVALVVVAWRRGGKVEWPGFVVTAIFAMGALVLLGGVWIVLLGPRGHSNITYHLPAVLVIAAGIYGMAMFTYRLPTRIGVLCLLIPVLGVVGFRGMHMISDGYTVSNGNTYQQRLYRKAELKYTAQSIEYLLMGLHEQAFPAELLTADSPTLAALPAVDRQLVLTILAKPHYRYTALPRWHTRITGLYRIKTTPVRLWYPGGRAKDVIGKMEWR